MEEEQQESVLDVDLGETSPKEKRTWQEAVKLRGHVVLRLGHRWGWPAVRWIAGLSLPFYVLVRGSMYAYQSLGWGTWSSIGLGIFGTVVVFSAYATWLWSRVTGEGRWPRILRPVLIAVVAGYGIYGLLYLSSGSAKDPDLGDYYMSLHPLMRLGASPFFLFDRNAVVTNLERRVEDYLAMGLSLNEAALHFKVGDRYVHAMDIRTTGRNPRRNALTVAYFRIMGFRSLQHVDSADHLHVSLPVRGR